MPIRLSALVFASSSSEVAHRLQGPHAERSTNPDFQTIRFRASSSHARDVSSDVYFLSVPPGDAHESGERGPSDYDIRNTFAGAVSYDIPSPRDGIAKPILGGWSTDSIIYTRSASPVNVVTGQDPFNTGFLSGAYGVTRPNLVPGLSLYLNESNAPGGKVINAAAFTIPATSVQGDLGRNALRGFGATQLDLTLRR